MHAGISLVSCLAHARLPARNERVGSGDETSSSSRLPRPECWYSACSPTYNCRLLVKFQFSVFSESANLEMSCGKVSVVLISVQRTQRCHVVRFHIYIYFFLWGGYRSAKPETPRGELPVLLISSSVNPEML